MAKYIEAEELKHILNASKYYGTKAGRDFADMIYECDAADVQEVRHGRWENSKRLGFGGIYHWFRQCSECLYEREDYTPEKDTNYCPNCGARMDLDEVTDGK